MISGSNRAPSTSHRPREVHLSVTTSGNGGYACIQPREVQGRVSTSANRATITGMHSREDHLGIVTQAVNLRP